MNRNPPRIVTVIVADDSALIRGRLCALLEAEPAVRVVAEASSAAEAMSQFERHRPDAVVLDIQMPDASGIEVLRRIKQSAPWCVVIMLTQFRESAFREICRILGADHFLNKAGEFDQIPGILRGLSQSPADVPLDP
jgi:DNA-binding NarL/FixJ family response regulator